MSTMDEGKRQKRPRRSFTDEFKAGAVRLVLDEGKAIPQVARDLDLTQSALRTWVERARADRTKGKTGLTSEERAELARLRKEVRELRMEREILKKAAVRSLGQRNTTSDRREAHEEGATRTQRFAEGRAVEAMERGTIAERHRAGVGQASRLDLRSRGSEWRLRSSVAQAGGLFVHVGGA